MGDDFYIGYLDKAPPRTARSVAAISLLLLAAAACVALILAPSQTPFYPSLFEFGTVRTYEGWYRADPAPMLSVRGPGGKTAVLYLLVSEGKHGAAGPLEGFENGALRLKATLIQRDDVRMLEVAAGSVERVSGHDVAAPPASESLGRIALSGEIVDSKCFLGVMNPGEKTVHRACAELCIRGGIPPMLIVRNDSRADEYVLLTGPAGEPINDRILPFVARPVSIEGSLFRLGDLYEMRIDPEAIRLLR